MVGGLITMAGGTLAASSFIISKNKNAKDLIDKLVPYMGWIGMVMFCWGCWELLYSVRTLSLLSTHPLTWAFRTACGVADLGVGFLLGFGLISKYTFRGNQLAIEKGQAVRAKLVKIQSPLGLVAIVMGALYIVF